ncbi:WxL protein peptidoglycan domain-containing protein [Melissospora conviva]|uniref:WxL protein peptidoglycan domain-containing protein n=1 Tax=Melissospora conviva TaxID=3388432 RepID=UPI003C1E7686
MRSPTVALRRLTLILLAGAIALVGAPLAPAHAAGNGEWAVTPTPPKKPSPAPRQYFFLDARPGTTITDSVRIQNLTKESKTFEVYGADAYNTERDGGFGLRTKIQTHIGIGIWTKLPVEAVTVPPRRQADVPFTITVPPNATPGDHVGGIVVLEAEPKGQVERDGVNVAIQRAVAARVYLTVAGPVVPGLAVSELEAHRPTPLLPTVGDGTIDYRIENTGNTHIAPKITITSSGLFGHEVRQTTPLPQLDLIPGASVQMTGKLAGIWPVDLVKVTVEAEGSEGISASRTDRELVVAWPVLLLLLLIAAATAWWIQRRRRARRPVPRGMRNNKQLVEAR